MAYLLDTDVLIDLFRENQGAADYIDSLDDWSYSVVTGMELIAVARNLRRRDASSFSFQPTTAFR